MAGIDPEKLFPGARSPQAAQVGLLLFFGCWNEAHEIAQEDESPEGSYWHAIIHRQEPDTTNASYWLHRVGKHPVFSQMGPEWDPYAFLKQCGEARLKPGSEIEQAAIETQHQEWQRLFTWCFSNPA